jgi:hypothetical protein
MNDFFNIVGSFGFPISVASYLLFRFEKKLDDLAAINRDLCVEISNLKNEIVNLKKSIAKNK